MGFDEGRIILSSDNGIYYSGQTVYGKLVFDQDKIKTFRGLYVKIKGFCKVHWTTTHTRTVNGKRETYTVTHESHEEYINQKVYLVGGENGEHALQPGHHEFPFQCALPGNCPSSFEGPHGHIRYEVKAVVDRAFKINQEKKAVIRVIALLDLNITPGAKDPVEIEFNKSYCCCCFRSGSTHAVVKLPVTGYCPGQTIPIEISCTNRGSVAVESIKFSLKKHIVFLANGEKSVQETLAELETEAVGAGGARDFAAQLRLPLQDAQNVRGCNYIRVDYRFKVTLKPDGCHSNSSDSRTIIIGSIPFIGSLSPNPMDQVVGQNVPVLNQPLPGQQPAYPGNPPYPGPGPMVSPYPGQNNYPSNTPYPDNFPPPYPGDNPPYPGNNSPYPGYNQPNLVEKSPYPGVSAQPAGNPYPGASSPYPNSNSPYPPSNTPYAGSNSPYPVTNPPYPGSNSPYPATNSPYPPAPVSASNFPLPKVTVPGLKTDTIGFIHQDAGKGMNMPAMPQGAPPPYPTQPPVNPFITPSAPQPDIDSNKY